MCKFNFRKISNQCKLTKISKKVGFGWTASWGRYTARTMEGGRVGVGCRGTKVIESDEDCKFDDQKFIKRLISLLLDLF